MSGPDTYIAEQGFFFEKSHYRERQEKPKVVSSQARIEFLEEQNDLLIKKVAGLEAQAIEREKEHARAIKKAFSYRS